MKKKLLAVNIVLAALAIFAGYQIRQGYLESRAREQRVLSQKPAVTNPNGAPARPAAPPVSPAQYVDVAQKMLFTADRNPTVILDPVKQPPPPPVPPFPVAHGVILFGDLPPTIILSQKGRNDQQGYKVGDTVGGFLIASIDNTDVVFTWNGQEFKKAIADLVDYSSPAPAATAPAVSASTAANRPAAPEPPKATSLSPEELKKPGQDMGGGFYACNAGDASPVGTVFNGAVKKESKNPFAPGGRSCYWEAPH